MGACQATWYNYHLIVALFDHTTQKRIPAAQLSAAVQEIGLGETRRKLEPMRIDCNLSYGAWFDLGGAGPYRVRLEVSRLDRHGKVSGQFEQATVVRRQVRPGAVPAFRATYGIAGAR